MKKIYLLIKKIWRKTKLNLNKILFFKKYRFWPPPLFSDLSGYETILDEVIKNKIYQLKGDFVEIGVFLGGGTYKISKLISRFSPNKKIYAIDIFDPNFDLTPCVKGITMKEIYQKHLKGKNQYEIYKKIIKGCDNIITIIKDSKKVLLPCKEVCFAYIDGNHSYDYVKNDFYLVWDKLVSKGIVSFDDYGYDLPEVTKAIDEIIFEKKNEISKIWKSGLKTIFIQKK